MGISNVLGAHVGEWVGTNGLRMLPTDDFAPSDATASVRLSAGGNTAVIAYTWADRDTPQDGLLVLGPGEGPSEVVGVFTDTWHQCPQWMHCVGGVDGAGVITVEGSYECDPEPVQWRVIVDATSPDTFVLAMDNDMPAEHVPTGPYRAVEMTCRRAR